jgi:hypothetical protein
VIAEEAGVTEEAGEAEDAGVAEDAGREMTKQEVVSDYTCSHSLVSGQLGLN